MASVTRSDNGPVQGRKVTVIDTATGQVSWSVEQAGMTYDPVPAGGQLALLALTDSRRVAVATVDVCGGAVSACVVIDGPQPGICRS